MTPSETAKFLALVALTDNRTVGQLDVQAWHEILPEGMSFADAQLALIQHRRDGSEWLMPSHIIANVRAIRRARLREAPVPEIPPDLHQAVERQWMRAFTDAVKDGDTDPQSAADEAMGIHRPPALHPARPDRVQAIRELAKTKGI